MKRADIKRVDIAGILFNPITQSELLDDIAHHIARNKHRTMTVMKPYVEFFVVAWSRPDVMAVLRRADRVVADGVAVQWASSYLHGKRGAYRLLHSLFVDIQRASWRQQVIPERGAGVDATHRLLKRACQEGWSVGILGGPKDTESTQEGLLQKYPNLRLCGVWDGYYQESQELEVITAISKKKLDILFVAQGFPKQELFIDKYRKQKIAKVLIGEGGTFDFDSMGGKIKRAPELIRKIGLEWLWRLVQQPSRWRRQLALPRFIWRIYTIGQQK